VGRVAARPVAAEGLCERPSAALPRPALLKPSSRNTPNLWRCCGGHMLLPERNPAEARHVLCTEAGMAALRDLEACEAIP